MVLIKSFIHVMKSWPLLDKIHIVKLRFKWMVASVLNYGKITIKTADRVRSLTKWQRENLNRAENRCYVFSCSSSATAASGEPGRKASRSHRHKEVHPGWVWVFTEEHCTEDSNQSVTVWLSITIISFSTSSQWSLRRVTPRVTNANYTHSLAPGEEMDYNTGISSMRYR